MNNLYTYVVLITIMTCFDLVNSVEIISRGGQEENPVMVWLFGFGYTVGGAVKVMTTAVFATFLAINKHIYPLYAVMIIYVILLIYQAYLLSL